MPAKWAETCTTLSIYFRPGGMLLGLNHPAVQQLHTTHRLPPFPLGVQCVIVQGYFFSIWNIVAVFQVSDNPNRQTCSKSILLDLPMVCWLQIVCLAFYLPLLTAFFNEPTQWLDRGYVLLV